MLLPVFTITCSNHRLLCIASGTFQNGTKMRNAQGIMDFLVCCLQIVQNLEHRKPNNPIRNYTNILQRKYHYCKPVVQMIYCTLKLFQF